MTLAEDATKFERADKAVEAQKQETQLLLEDRGEQEAGSRVRIEELEGLSKAAAAELETVRADLTAELETEKTAHASVASTAQQREAELQERVKQLEREAVEMAEHLDGANQVLLQKDERKADGRREQERAQERLRKERAAANERAEKLASELDREKQLRLKIDAAATQKKREYTNHLGELEQSTKKSEVNAAAAKDELEKQSRLVSELTSAKALEEKALRRSISDLQGDARRLKEAVQTGEQEAADQIISLKAMQKELADRDQRIESQRARARKKEEALKLKIDRLKGQPRAAVRVGDQTSVVGARKIPIINIVGAVFVVCAFALGIIRGRSGAPREAVIVDMGIVPAVGAHVPERAVVEPSVETRPDVAAIERAAINWPDMGIEGLAVTERDGGKRLVFDEAVFAYMTTVAGTAKAQLREIGKRLLPRAADFVLVIEGHTDDVPMSPQSGYPSNYELGMARAQAVVEFLKQEAGLPAAALIPLSSGKLDPPYPNDNDELRVKNRTVVLKLLPVIGQGEQ